MSAQPNVSRHRTARLAVLGAGGALVVALTGGCSVTAGDGPSGAQNADARPGAQAEGGQSMYPPRPATSAATTAGPSAEVSTEPGSTSGAASPDTPAPATPTDEVMTTSLIEVFEEELEILTDLNLESSDAVSDNGPYAAALANKITEFEAADLTQTGAPRIVFSDVLEDYPDEDPPRVVVYACLDNSDVDVVDAEGNSLVNEGSPPRSAQIYTLVWENSRWAILDATFPDDPNC